MLIQQHTHNTLFYMKIKLLSLLAIMLVAMNLISCEKEKGEDPYFSIDESPITFLSSGGEKYLDVRTNVRWEINPVDEDWLTINSSTRTSPVLHYVDIAASANTEDKVRTATLTIEPAGLEPISISITQAPHVTDAKENIEFTDNKFKAALLRVSNMDVNSEEYDGHLPKKIDANSDGEISMEEAAAVTMINVSYSEITDITEISHFTSITNLYINDNDLTSIDLSKNLALELLNCSFNNLTELDLSTNSELRALTFEANKIASGLDFSNNLNLNYLNGSVNKISAINLSLNSKLEILKLNNNLIQELDLSKCTELSFLWCHSNKLSHLDVTLNSKLEEIACDGNQLTEIDLSKSTMLHTFLANRNNFRKLDLSKNTKLITLETDNNAISELILPNINNIKRIDISHNLLAAFDPSAYTNLEHLDASVNKFTTIDVSKNLNLNYLGVTRNHLSTLDVSMLSKLSQLFCGGQTSSDGNSQDITVEMTTAQSQNGLPNDEVVKDIIIKLVDGETIENIVFVDQELKKALLDSERTHIPRIIDTNLDREISMDEALLVTSLDLAGGSITSLEDLKYFTNISYIDADGNNISEIDLNMLPLLQILYASENEITEINVSQNPELTNLFLSKNQISTIDLSKNLKLRGFLIDNNKLEELNLSHNDKIAGLYAHANHLSALDVSNTSISAEDEFYCGKQTDGAGNNRELTLTMTEKQIEEGIFKAHESVNANVVVKTKEVDPESIIEFSSQAFKDAVLLSGRHTPANVDSNSDNNISVGEALAVTSLDLSNTSLTDIIDIRYFKNITSINLSNNNLSAADFSGNQALKSINLEENELTSIDVTKNSKLEELFVNSNRLEIINVKNNLELKTLVSNGNDIFGIDLSANSKLGILKIYDNHLFVLNISKNLMLNELLCGKQTSEDGEFDRTMELMMTQSQFNANLLDTSNDLNKNVTVEIVDKPIAGVEYTLTTIPKNGADIKGDTWIITDSGSPSTENLTNLNSALRSAGRVINLELPNITMLPSSAFYGITTLASLKANELSEISTEMFFGAEGLVKIEAPKATIIRSDAFLSCSALMNVILPKVTTVEANAFGSCSALLELSLPEATSIGAQAFYSAGALTTIYLPKVQSIGAKILRWSRAVTTLTLATESIITDMASDVFANTTISGINVTIGSNSGLTVDGTSFSFESNTYGPFASVTVK